MPESQAPKKTAGDAGHAVVRSALGVIPFAGSAATELFSAIISPPIERRRTAWMEEIGERLQSLEEAGLVTREQLENDEAFASTLLQASTIAMRHHEDEKLQFLRNAVLNSAMIVEPDESRRQMFLHWVDELTVTHLRVLSLLRNPRQWFKDNDKQEPTYMLSSSLSRLITDAFPKLASEREFVSLVHKELVARGLLKDSELSINMSAGGAFELRATEIGVAFLEFVSKDPAELEENT